MFWKNREGSGHWCLVAWIASLCQALFPPDAVQVCIWCPPCSCWVTAGTQPLWTFVSSRKTGADHITAVHLAVNAVKTTEFIHEVYSAWQIAGALSPLFLLPSQKSQSTPAAQFSIEWHARLYPLAPLMKAPWTRGLFFKAHLQLQTVTLQFPANVGLRHQCTVHFNFNHLPENCIMIAFAKKFFQNHSCGWSVLPSLHQEKQYSGGWLSETSQVRQRAGGQGGMWLHIISKPRLCLH